MDIRRYDIVQADLGKAVGSEQAGIRPVCLLLDNKLAIAFTQCLCSNYC